MSLDAEGTLQENSQREREGAAVSALASICHIEHSVRFKKKYQHKVLCKNSINNLFFRALFFYKNVPKKVSSFNEVLINWKDDRWENSLQEFYHFYQ